MVFSSLFFLFRFLPLVLLVYFVVPRKFRNFILFISSLLFYAWGEPKYVLIMIFSTVVDYTHGRLVDYFKSNGKIRFAKISLISSIIINIGILGFFKYTDMLLDSINSITGSNIAMLNIALPIGISFYTFQTMSYTIDVYRGAAKVQKNIISFGTYVALFPQLIAGPIVQYKTIADEIDNRRENQKDFANGIEQFIIGLAKKVLLANNAGAIFDVIKDAPIKEIPMISAWIGIIAFTFQIYFDFSGYSDMAIGLGRMFGFHFNENFDYPYTSKSITEFWRRWHISLGTWFREYVYIPMGGNRRGRIRLFRNILVVWGLTGLWHGASYNFLLWGLFFAVILLLEKTLLLHYLEKVPAVISHIYTMFLVIISWVIFSFDKLEDGIDYIKSMFMLNGQAFVNRESIFLFCSNLALIIVLIFASTPIPAKLVGRMRKKINNDIIDATITNLFLVIIFILSISYLVTNTYNPFLYFRF